jgi:hypothetical protein
VEQEEVVVAALDRVLRVVLQMGQTVSVEVAVEDTMD